MNDDVAKALTTELPQGFGEFRQAIGELRQGFQKGKGS
jgi:hypothetical protein